MNYVFIIFTSNATTVKPVQNSGLLLAREFISPKLTGPKVSV